MKSLSRIGSTLILAAQAAFAADVVFEEKNGLVAVEAEHFYKQTKTGMRQWRLTTATQQFKASDDADGPHVIGSGGGAYLECLPDTRHHHGHKLIRGENFSPEAGKMAVLHYKIHFNNPGKYYVWVRCFSTGSEDNGIHVGLNGEWPASGQRLQWCEGKRTWRWESKQRTQKNHCGEPYKIFLEIKRAGVNEISFSMREDGFEFDRFLMTKDRNFKRPVGVGPTSAVKSGMLPAAHAIPAGYKEKGEPVERLLAKAASVAKPKPAKKRAKIVRPRKGDGSGSIKWDGEAMMWHKMTMTIDGPFAHELDVDPNPFTDIRLEATFTHRSGSPVYVVPGYFAADGDAANTSAQSGTKWRVNFVPDKMGVWGYSVRFWRGENVALATVVPKTATNPLSVSGEFQVHYKTDKTGRDLRGKGRLQYVGKRYLRFAGTGEYFLKAGADAPETFLGYADFDGTVARKSKVPLKTWAPHVKDWRPGDPTWKNGKGKGMIGAINYLADKGCNVFSFLTYNAGGDGDNVWPFVARDEKLNYDCSKLDQWQIVFDHATTLGHYLHFKLQETEMDDNRRGGHKPGQGKPHAKVSTSLDGGALGIERKLYCREMVARFGHLLALNWNLGEENTQSTAEQTAMAKYIHDLDPYDHIIVVHTFPNQQDKVYPPLFGKKSKLSGFSLQNSNIRDTHWQVVKWVNASAKAGKPWVTAFDESGTAQYAQVPDLGYDGFNGFDKEGKKVHTQHEVRKYTLWGTLMGGGIGCEYYFGYKLPQNDLICEDWRSRDQSWDYCRIALDFFRDHKIPFWEMNSADGLVGTDPKSNDRYCLAKPGSVYLVYLPNGGTTNLDLTKVKGSFKVQWFNPRSGGTLQSGSAVKITGGKKVGIGRPPSDETQDWLVVIRR